jgi:mono/diheme cytochrome c family protein
MTRVNVVAMLMFAGCPSPDPQADAPPGAPPRAELPATLGLGHAASPQQIAAWDIDVDPSGRDLPAGRGSVDEGAKVYATQCMACHGAKGEGGVGPKLIGPEPKTGFADDWKDHPRTIGNWWPYATTVFDYVRRAMPQHAPGSLTDDQVYGLTAYLLAENGIVGRDFVADAKSVPAVKMGTKVQFVEDDRGGTTVR